MTTITASKRAGISGLLFGLFIAAAVFGWIPNPLERYWEAGPGIYHEYGKVYLATSSTRYKEALKDVLDRDGRLTQGNMKPLWRLYEDAMPNGYELGTGDGDNDVATERQGLIALVGAHPKTE
jgi:hypothetical protein